MEESQKKVGGLGLLISILSLIVISISNVAHIWLLWDSTALKNLFPFIIGAVIAFGISDLYTTGRRAVLIHELKHAILSSFAGNKWKRLRVKKTTGDFQYAYTKETAHMNALIALAPYWFPLFTLFALLFTLTPYLNYFSLRVLIGAAFLGDLISNWREISPYQTDFSQIRGGFAISMLYIIPANLTIMTFIAAWAMQGLYGIKFLLYCMWNSATDILLQMLH